MADSTAAAGLVVQQWDDKFFKEYLGQNKFAKYMGTGSDALIQVREDLSKKRGDSITFALVNQLSGNGVTGSSTLEGNEEAMTSRSFQVTVDKHRNAVRMAEMEEQQSAIDLRDAARGVLMDWIMEELRDDIITALGSINGTAYGSASEAAKDAYLVDNTDRVHFAGGSGSGTDHSADLATITAADKMDATDLGIIKRKAQSASPRIRPIRLSDGSEYYVVFAHQDAFRDLQTDTTVSAANRDARLRGVSNPIFTGGEILYNGLAIVEVPEIPAIGTVGACSARVVPNYLCGAQSIALAYAKRPRSIVERFDYEDKYGVAIDEIRAVEKMKFGSGSADTDDLKDHGVVTYYCAAAAD